jgi:hypothetical protein
VATFADCHEFTPPRGTRWLCDRTPPAKRPAPRHYVFVGGPIKRRYGSPDRVPARALSELDRFSKAAALHQPLDWLRVSVEDFGSYIDPPNDAARSPAGYTEFLTAPLATGFAKRQSIDGYYSSARIIEHAGLLDALRDYERVTRLEGVPMAALLLLALAAPLACRGWLRAGSLLFAGVAYATMAVPVVTLDYDARFGVPAYGPLAGAAAMGLCGVVTRIRERRAAGGPSG